MVIAVILKLFYMVAVEPEVQMVMDMELPIKQRVVKVLVETVAIFIEIHLFWNTCPPVAHKEPMEAAVAEEPDVINSMVHMLITQAAVEVALVV